MIQTYPGMNGRTARGAFDPSNASRRSNGHG